MTYIPSILTRAICGLCVAWLALAALPLTSVSGQGPTTTPYLDQLLADLTGEDLLAAERAAQELALIGTAEIVPQLIDIFQTSDTPRLAATALGGIGTQRATQALADALVDEDLTARRNAAQIGLLRGGEQTINTLVATLRVPEVPARRHAAELLGYLGSPFAVNGLVRAAQQDADPSVRQSAVWALSEIDSTRVRPTLVSISVRDPDPAVRAEAESAIARLDQRYQ